MIVFAAVAVAGVGALLAAAAADQRWTAFSADVPPSQPVTALSPGQQFCQGPLKAIVGFGSVRAWVSPNAPPGAALQLRVRSLSGATIASGRIPAGYGHFFDPTFNLGVPVRGSRRVYVCLRSAGPEPVTLLGANRRLAFLFLRRQPQSLLSLLPTVFKRAALFRPGWVGPWTFWLLLIGLIAAFVLGGIAVAQAASSDASDRAGPSAP